MQTMQIEVKIPDDMVLIKKVDYEALKENEYLVTGDMKWLTKTTNIKTPYTLTEILYKHRDQLEDFVIFPDQGANWTFLKKPMSEFYENNLHLFKKGSR